MQVDFGRAAFSTVNARLARLSLMIRYALCSGLQLLSSGVSWQRWRPPSIAIPNATMSTEELPHGCWLASMSCTCHHLDMIGSEGDSGFGLKF